MSDLAVQAAQKIGQILLNESFMTKPTLEQRLLPNGVRLDEVGAVLLAVRGPITGRTLGIVDDGNRVLVWSQALGCVVNMSKIRDSDKPMLKCHQVLLDCMAADRANRPWLAALQQLAEGRIWAGVRALGLAELIMASHTMHGPEKVLFLELMRRYHADACLEVV